MIQSPSLPWAGSGPTLQVCCVPHEAMKVTGQMLALEVDQLKKTYANGVEALKGVSLRVEEGDFLPCSGPMARASPP